ncbi:hypothetical protein N9S81_00495, partial [bacterium]|nr:hypothetical protein [bacterium]
MPANFVTQWRHDSNSNDELKPRKLVEDALAQVAMHEAFSPGAFTQRLGFEFESFSLPNIPANGPVRGRG